MSQNSVRTASSKLRAKSLLNHALAELGNPVRWVKGYNDPYHQTLLTQLFHSNRQVHGDFTQSGGEALLTAHELVAEAIHLQFPTFPTTFSDSDLIKAFNDAPNTRYFDVIAAITAAINA